MSVLPYLFVCLFQTGSKVLPSKLDPVSNFNRSQLKVSEDLSGSRWTLFRETISVNDLYYFVSVKELG